MPKRNPDDYVDQGATMEDAARDLSPEDFMALMAEMGRELLGPKEAPAKPKLPEMSREERIEAIRAKIRGLFKAGHRLNRDTASDFYREVSEQRLMGTGTGGAAEALSDRIKRGQF